MRKDATARNSWSALKTYERVDSYFIYIKLRKTTKFFHLNFKLTKKLLIKIFYSDGDLMPLTKDEIYELQEKLLLLYKFINQNKMYKEFYYQGIEVKQNYNDNIGLISKFMTMNGAKELLKNCVIELEEMKGEKLQSEREVNSDEEFHEIFSSQDWNFLYKLYEMKNLDDIRKLDLELMLKIF
jgi:hypothetical protein